MHEAYDYDDAMYSNDEDMPARVISDAKLLG